MNIRAAVVEAWDGYEMKPERIQAGFSDHLAITLEPTGWLRIDAPNRLSELVPPRCILRLICDKED